MANRKLTPSAIEDIEKLLKQRSELIHFLREAGKASETGARRKVIYQPSFRFYGMPEGKCIRILNKESSIFHCPDLINKTIDFQLTIIRRIDYALTDFGMDISSLPEPNVSMLRPKCTLGTGAVHGTVPVYGTVTGKRVGPK